ncbi:molybdopterin-guanine dinucleotide biosynthesis protein B [candidate division WOR-3 bacterium]|nr:molybdopterin-guanine dinucleotide biosynthesis protein B [candidate division WOR-3 bacterium]
MHRIYSFIGDSNSGKTTLISKIIVELTKRNYTVGAVKHCSKGFEIDRKGKDSYIFRERGADPVLLISKSDVALLKKNSSEEPMELINRYFSNRDFVIVEGGRNWNGIKKIEVIGNERERLQLDCRPVAIITDEEIYADVPLFRKDEVEKIVNFMENTK